MTESKALATVSQQPDALAFLYDGPAFEHLWRVAQAFAISGMVPDCYANKPAACMVALMYAQRMNESPMLIFAEMAPYKGKPITSAKFAIGRANKSGMLHGPINWKSKGSGEALEVTASAKIKETGETVTATVTMKEAIADGWTRNAKYTSMPEQMLRWRSATRLINLYIPEVLAGAGVREEAEVTSVTVREDAPAADAGGVTVADLNRQIAASAELPVTAQVVETQQAELVPVEAEPAQQPRFQHLVQEPPHEAVNQVLALSQSGEESPVSNEPAVQTAQKKEPF